MDESRQVNTNILLAILDFIKTTSIFNDKTFFTIKPALIVIEWAR